MLRHVLCSLPTVGIGPGGSELQTPPGSSPPMTAAAVHARPRFRPPWSTPTLTGHANVLRVRLSSVSPSSRAPFPSLSPSIRRRPPLRLRHCCARPRTQLGRPEARGFGEVPVLDTPAWAGTRPAPSATLPACAPAWAGQRLGHSGWCPACSPAWPA